MTFKVHCELLVVTIFSFSEYHAFFIFQAVLLEIQRLCPVVPLGVPHGTIKEIILNKKWLIPKGSMIMVAHWNLNYDEEQFENPKEFKPNGFLDKDGKHISHIQKSIMLFQVSLTFYNTRGHILSFSWFSVRFFSCSGLWLGFQNCGCRFSEMLQKTENKVTLQ